MTLAEKIFWFKYDNNDIAKDQQPQVEAQINNVDFLKEVADYLDDIITSSYHSIQNMGDPTLLEGFDIILYEDFVHLHKRASALWVELVAYQPKEVK